MKPTLAETEPIETYAEIHRLGIIYDIISLAKKYLPQECVFVFPDRIINLAIFPIFRAIKKFGEIQSLEQICSECPAKATVCGHAKRN